MCSESILSSAIFVPSTASPAILELITELDASFEVADDGGVIVDFTEESSIEMEPGVIYGYSGSHYDQRNLEWVAAQLGVTCSFYNTSTESTTLIYKKSKSYSPRYTTNKEIEQVKQNLSKMS